MQLIKKNTKKLSGNRSSSHTVLALVGDTQVGLWVVRSLARNGLTVHAVVHSRHGQSAHSRFAASAWLLDHSPGSKEFIRELKEL
ncbi:MAG TPA: carboxylate--amine ligase, partial [Bacteroidetes bacterium]|nr:carboxylate--amine ligase [Bacteroidota bacterium]